LSPLTSAEKAIAKPHLSCVYVGFVCDVCTVKTKGQPWITFLKVIFLGRITAITEHSGAVFECLKAQKTTLHCVCVCDALLLVDADF